MILLDTHTFVWWIGNPEFLSIKAKQEIDKGKKKKKRKKKKKIKKFQHFFSNNTVGVFFL